MGPGSFFDEDFINSNPTGNSFFRVMLGKGFRVYFFKFVFRIDKTMKNSLYFFKRAFSKKGVKSPVGG